MAEILRQIAIKKCRIVLFVAKVHVCLRCDMILFKLHFRCAVVLNLSDVLFFSAMGVQKSSIWEARKRICFMNGKNTASRKDDDNAIILELLKPREVDFHAEVHSALWMKLL